MAEKIPCEPSENVASVDSDSAQTPQSDSVPKLCRKWQCHKVRKPRRAPLRAWSLTFDA